MDTTTPTPTSGEGIAVIVDTRYGRVDLWWGTRTTDGKDVTGISSGAYTKASVSESFGKYAVNYSSVGPSNTADAVRTSARILGIAADICDRLNNGQRIDDFRTFLLPFVEFIFVDAEEVDLGR